MSDPGNAGFPRLVCAEVCAGKPWVLMLVGDPEMLMFLILLPVAPNAKPACGGAVPGMLMMSVYEVPLPDAVHVSPVGAWTAALEAGIRIAPAPTAAIIALDNRVMSLSPFFGSGRHRRFWKIPGSPVSHSPRHVFPVDLNPPGVGPRPTMAARTASDRASTATFRRKRSGLTHSPELPLARPPIPPSRASRGFSPDSDVPDDE